ncbi:class E sortase [Streptomyces sp. MBT56]|uniref:class E sortase n=1 Tax=unclassified Streptomyces TaxID=2593676 RepID=UPI00190A27C1|nr:MULTISPECIES: class E sortase [unclassified Streptomyces]MBK3557398.1 class E sortase [Streptomyces sp. MBT56]MBK3605763.1 class E sortase [Streptomyces sp. MBT54]MBK3618314.1 class E sortase [Streptomyces sp. MBT98]MBK6046341.1 class E sortase [Streptomyces sp. MBT55]
MTAGRPGPAAGPEGSDAHGAYGTDGAFVAAVDGLADPLNDPLPGGHTSPWFRSDTVPAAEPAAPSSYVDGYAAHQGPQQPHGAPNEWYDPAGYQRDWYGPQEPSARMAAADPVSPVAPAEERAPAPVPDLQDFTAEPRTEVLARIPAEPEPEPEAALDPAPAPGGRAERRRAAKGRGRRRPGTAPEQQAAPAAAVPMSRVEARRAARAAKDSPAVIASRAVGEVFISLGVLMLLFVTYQLWWTNIRADQIAGKETNRIQDEWANGDRKPGVFAPGEGFAIMHIPKLDVVAPIAEGIDKEKVLDRGMIGHYGEGKLKTAMPSDKQGNFSVAGHRNTHGEPFRYINKLKPGDPIVVETRDAYYTYEMAQILPQTSPSNISVIEPIPVGSGFTKPGRYLTLTTCTPEFTSTYRLIVWGKMVDERPRSEGKPDALVG